MPIIESTGGLILMRCGKELFLEDLTDEMRRKVYKDCLHSLYAMHEHNLCHTDVREANVVQFDGTFQVIDFGEVVTEGSTVDCSTFSTNRQHPLPLAFRLKGKNFRWTRVHDVEMLTNMIFRVRFDSSDDDKRGLAREKQRERYGADVEGEGDSIISDANDEGSVDNSDVRRYLHPVARAESGYEDGVIIYDAKALDVSHASPSALQGRWRKRLRRQGGEVVVQVQEEQVLKSQKLGNPSSTTAVVKRKRCPRVLRRPTAEVSKRYSHNM